jgi:hypothetical protein
MSFEQMSGFETPENPTNSDPSQNDAQQPSAFRNMDRGNVTGNGSSMGDEGKTTSRVNKAAEDDGDDKDDTGDDIENGSPDLSQPNR